jgi:hypothetical protein
VHRLDDVPVSAKRVVDNAGFSPAGKDPRAIPDEELDDRPLHEFRQWLTAARAQGTVSG